MEALAALGVACNIMQVISFCHETVSVSLKIYKNGSSDLDLAKNASQIQKLAEQLDVVVNNSAAILTSNSQPRAEVVAIARDCASTAKELGLKLNQTTSSKAGAVGRALKIRLQKSKLDDLEQKLMRHQQTLQSRLLFEIWCVVD